MKSYLGTILLVFAFSQVSLAQSSDVIKIKSATLYIKPSSSKTELSYEQIIFNQKKEINSFFNIKRVQDLEIKLLGSKEFYEQTGSASWVDALYLNKVIYIKSSEPSYFKIKKSVFKNLFTHEYIHAVVDRLTNSNCPAWLDEGLAMLLTDTELNHLDSIEQNRIENKNLAHYKLPHLSNLTNSFVEFEQGLASIAYRKSILATSRLLEAKNYDILKSFLVSLKSRDINASLKRYYSLEYNEIEELSNTRLLATLR